MSVPAFSRKKCNVFDTVIFNQMIRKLNHRIITIYIYTLKVLTFFINNQYRFIICIFNPLLQFFGSILRLYRILQNNNSIKKIRISQRENIGIPFFTRGCILILFKHRKHTDIHSEFECLFCKPLYKSSLKIFLRLSNKES